MLRTPRAWLYLLALAAAVLGAVLAAPFLSRYFGQWRRPLVGWLVDQHLVGSWLWYVVHGIHLRDVVVGCVAGLLLGWYSYHYWRRMAVLFALVYVFARVVYWHFTGYLDHQLLIYGPAWLLNIPTQFVMLLPTALLAAWFSSRPQRRRRERRRAAGCCPGCGYDLRGGWARRCPECGEALRAPAGPPSAGNSGGSGV